jgi:hypothetical protein
VDPREPDALAPGCLLHHVDDCPSRGAVLSDKLTRRDILQAGTERPLPNRLGSLHHYYDRQNRQKGSQRPTVLLISHPPLIGETGVNLNARITET